MPKEIIKKTPEAKELHKIILEIYDIFKKICEKEGYRYFAISGTTIGAGFWKGIIPWDDDMDIAMPIEDSFRCALIPRGMPTSTKQKEAIAKTKRFENSTHNSDLSRLRKYLSVPLILLEPWAFSIAESYDLILSSTSKSLKSLSFFEYLESLSASLT